MPKYICSRCKWESDFEFRECSVCRSEMRDYEVTDFKHSPVLPYQPPAPLDIPQPECPFCHAKGSLFRVRRTSGAGYVVAVLLLFLCLPLFWLGFFVQEDATFCRVCNTKIS